MTEFAPTSRCDVAGCGHWYSDHTGGLLGPVECISCERFSRRHEFKPRVLAGGATTPEAELEAYQKAMRGE